MQRLLQTSSLLLITLLSFSVWGKSLQAERQSIIERDPRNRAVEFSLSISDKQLNFCVTNITGEGRPMDVFRVFLHTAAQLKNRSFQHVNLCFRQQTRFVLSGSHFTTLGEELETQNPTYTLRTFPEKLKRADGQAAFDVHQGGLIYLMRAQMSDFNRMNKAWYLAELVKEREAKKNALRPKSFAPDNEVF